MEKDQKVNVRVKEYDMVIFKRLNNYLFTI
jgi:hypothetical protein